MKFRLTYKKMMFRYNGKVPVTSQMFAVVSEL